VLGSRVVGSDILVRTQDPYIVPGRVVDPDSVTLWIRIRIGNPDPGARKLRNFSGKMHFLVTGIKKKKFTTKKV
jgi:hypothetical protein